MMQNMNKWWQARWVTVSFGLAWLGSLGSLLLAAAPPKPTSQPTSRRVLPVSRAASHPSSKRALPSATTQAVAPQVRSVLKTKPLPKETSIPPKRVEGVKGLLLAYTGGLKSYYEPCGCQADMLGGLPRLSSFLAGYRHVGLQPLLVDAGNLYFEALTTPTSKKTQTKYKSEFVADMFRLMEFRVAGIGPYDLVRGVDVLRGLVKRSGTQTLSSNVIDLRTKLPILPTHTVIRWGGKKVGFFSLTGTPTLPSKKDPWPKGFWSDRKLKVLNPVQAAKKQVETLRKKGATHIVLLSTLGTSALESLLGQVRGIDVAIEGNEDLEFDPPRRHGGAFVVSTPKEGQKVGVLALYSKKPGLDWAAVETVQQRAIQIKKMHKQVQAYKLQAKKMKAQGAAFGPVAAIYEKQAQDLLKKIAVKKKNRETKPKLKPNSNGFLAFLIPLSKKLGEHPQAVARLKVYEKEVKEANLLALQKIKPVPKTKDGDFYAGVNKCKMCHMPAYNFWKKTQHAKAYSTLVKKQKQFDLDCIGCHVVGWQESGGLYDIKKPERLANVQCENCHSRGGLHSVTADKKKIHRKVTAKVCTQCHQGSHHPDFNFEKKLKYILGKGHGEARLAELLKKEKAK